MESKEVSISLYENVSVLLSEEAHPGRLVTSAEEGHSTHSSAIDTAGVTQLPVSQFNVGKLGRLDCELVWREAADSNLVEYIGKCFLTACQDLYSRLQESSLTGKERMQILNFLCQSGMVKIKLHTLTGFNDFGDITDMVEIDSGDIVVKEEPIDHDVDIDTATFRTGSDVTSTDFEMDEFITASDSGSATATSSRLSNTDTSLSVQNIKSEGEFYGHYTEVQRSDGVLGSFGNSTHPVDTTSDDATVDVVNEGQGISEYDDTSSNSGNTNSGHNAANWEGDDYYIMEYQDANMENGVINYCLRDQRNSNDTDYCDDLPDMCNESQNTVTALDFVHVKLEPADEGSLFNGSQDDMDEDNVGRHGMASDSEGIWNGNGNSVWNECDGTSYVNEIAIKREPYQPTDDEQTHDCWHSGHVREIQHTDGLIVETNGSTQIEMKNYVPDDSQPEAGQLGNTDKTAAVDIPKRSQHGNQPWMKRYHDGYITPDGDSNLLCAPQTSEEANITSDNTSNRKTTERAVPCNLPRTEGELSNDLCPAVIDDNNVASCDIISEPVESSDDVSKRETVENRCIEMNCNIDVEPLPRNGLETLNVPAVETLEDEKRPGSKTTLNENRETKLLKPSDQDLHSKTGDDSGKLKAEEFGEKCSSDKKLLKSERKSSKERLRTCGCCGQSFKNRQRLYEHRRERVEKLHFPCNLCDSKFPTRSRLNYHMVKHCDEKPYTCEQCGKAFKYKYYMIEHQRLHTGEKPFKCTKCGDEFSSKSVYRYHLRKHANVRPFPCELCSKRFLTPGNLRDHMRTHRTTTSPTTSHPRRKVDRDQIQEQPQFECEHCKKKFCWKSSWKQHLKIHTRKDLLKCKICEKTLNSVTAFRRHTDSHKFPVKKYPCHVCGKEFKDKRYLQEHILRHSDKKPFQCKQCGKGFVKNSYLKLHLASAHAEGSLLPCDVCEKTFSCKSKLKTHKKVHQNVTSKSK